MFYLITYFTDAETNGYKTEAAAKKEGEAALKRGAKKVIVHCDSNWELHRTSDSKWELIEN